LATGYSKPAIYRAARVVRLEMTIQRAGGRSPEPVVQGVQSR
jgi:hypothetical protein